MDKNNFQGKLVFGRTCLYLPLNDYDKNVITLSLSFDNGLYYSNIYIYYRQSNDLNITNPAITKLIIPKTNIKQNIRSILK